MAYLLKGRLCFYYFSWINDVLVSILLLNMSALFEAAIAPGSHLFPFRTEQLSPVAPMVLHTRGRVGRRHFNYISGGFLKPDFGNPPFFVSLCRSRRSALRRGTVRFPGFVPALFFGMGVLLQLRQNCLSTSASGGSRQCCPVPPVTGELFVFCLCGYFPNLSPPFLIPHLTETSLCFFLS